MIDIIIRGGTVVAPGGVGKWDVAIEGERIDVARALVSVRSAVIFLHEPMQSRNSGSTARALDEGRIPERKKNRRVPL